MDLLAQGMVHNCRQWTGLVFAKEGMRPHALIIEHSELA